MFLDLIHFKSPTSTNDSDSKFPISPKSVHRTKWFDLDNVQTNSSVKSYERFGTLPSVDRFSTVLNPTATSFSKDELNEIFNIGREDMEIEKSSAKENSNNDLSLDTSLQSNDEGTLHNVALNQSNISLDDSVIGTPKHEITDSSEMKTSNNELPSLVSRQNIPPLNLDSDFQEPQKQCFENGEIMNPRAPFTPTPDKNVTFSHVQMVCREMFITEKTYVNDLQEVIEVRFLCVFQ